MRSMANPGDHEVQPFAQRLREQGYSEVPQSLPNFRRGHAEEPLPELSIGVAEAISDFGSVDASRGVPGVAVASLAYSVYTSAFSSQWRPKLSWYMRPFS